MTSTLQLTDNESCPLIHKTLQDEPSNKSQNEKQNIDITWTQIIGGSIGNIFEWYDWATFGMLAGELAQNFFISQSDGDIIELMETYGVFGAAFIMRPIGGLLFGIMGDKIGRKISLQVSTFMMFLSTCLMGCLPTYSTIGIYAPMLLTLLRIFQGISAGGQLIGSILFILENCKPEKRGIYGAIVIFTSSFGAVLASWTVALVNALLSKDQMYDWGWRLPFLLSLLMAFFGFFSQKHMDESREFLNAEKNEKPSAMSAIRNHWKTMVQIIIILIPWCCGGYLTFTFLPVYFESELNIKNSLLINSFFILWKMLIYLVGGYLCDKLSDYRIVLKIAVFLLFLCSFPSYFIMYKVNILNEELVFWPLILNDFVSGIALGLFGGAMNLFLFDCVNDVCARYTVIGIAYNVCQAMFGGTAPLIGSALSMFGFFCIGVYLSVASLVSLTLLLFV